MNPSVGGVSWILAFFAGVVSFVSPCVLPLIPGYISMVSNLSFQELKKEDVEHVAKLSRLELSDAEIEKFTPQLSSVFEMFEKLDAEDLKNVEETSQVTGLENVTREDEIKCLDDLTCCTSEELLKNVPVKEGSSILVPKVIEDK